ncbi:50S ribosomal protein L3 N(5)-glutamine methyltransferase [Alsobacter sp. SYSU M60028]|uniref:50S ribosomal protein L3 N(5)-glutamine methyltransferase n=1 Tax=Alsobacter ponti TaxID=2962936 RepID=A0ABT1L6E7_9HYPH|nr:50S ribosomal protein L3 N(5)-glutamine methyltransferase [Alsobacter ponti]
MPQPKSTTADELVTVRDLFRWAISRFNEADLYFGHGATTALDEAAFIVLEGLHLPVDQLDPFLDARLTLAERRRLVDLIERRVSTRKPAAYLLGRTYIQGIPFRVDERVIVPRSFLGELMLGDAFAGDDLLPEGPGAVESVLELCTGSGCLAIIAAMRFPNARVDAVDLSPEALEVATLNVAEHAMTERIELLRGDLFAPVAGRRYDLILTNPPYVDAETMALLPPEYRHEPELALAGGEDGLDIVRRILAGAPDHLNPGGGLLCEIGTGREVLEAEYPNLPFLWLDTEDSEGEVFWLSEADFR